MLRFASHVRKSIVEIKSDSEDTLSITDVSTMTDGMLLPNLGSRAWRKVLQYPQLLPLGKDEGLEDHIGRNGD